MPVITESDGKGGLKAAQGNKGGGEKEVGKTMQHLPHNKGPGPAIPDKMPEKANDDELKQRFKELNQDDPRDE